MCHRAGKIRHSQATFPLRLAPHLQAPHNQSEAVGLAHWEGLAQPPRRGLSLPLCPQGCPSRALLLAFKAPSPHRLRTIALSDTSMHAVEVTYRDGESRWAPFWKDNELCGTYVTWWSRANGTTSKGGVEKNCYLHVRCYRMLCGMGDKQSINHKYSGISCKTAKHFNGTLQQKDERKVLITQQQFFKWGDNLIFFRKQQRSPWNTGNIPYIQSKVSQMANEPS